jgi:ferredoxin
MDVPSVARWVRAGDFAQALAVVRQTIALPGVLGHICPEPCAKGCHRSAHDGGLAVCALKRGLVAQELASGPISPPTCAPDTGKSVAIVGTGPTGLAAAFELLQRGYRVTLIDKATQLGGALRTHVPPAELPPELLDAELDVLLRMGITLRLGCSFGPELTTADLRGQYDAVLLALGPMTPALAEAHGWPWRGQGVLTQSYRLGTTGLYAAGAMVIPTRLAVKGLAHVNPVATMKPMRFSVHRPHPHITVIPQTPATTTHTPEAMSLEAQRCLQCGCAVADSCRLRNYAEEYGARWSTHNPTQIPPPLITSHPEVDIDISKCIGCGLCVEVTKQAREPVGLTLAGRGLTFHLATPLGVSWAQALTHSASRCAEVCPTGAIVRRGGMDDS